jgi:predicted RNA-binding Zn-ribbon protein involved in translation (DUF1610 family)
MDMDTLGVLIFAFSIVLTIRVMIEGAREHGRISDSGSMVCPSCGTRGEPKIIPRGSMVIEFFLWMCFLVPGLLYAIWRETKKTKACPACGAEMIKVNSPGGRSLVEKPN